MQVIKGTITVQPKFRDPGANGESTANRCAPTPPGFPGPNRNLSFPS